MKLVALLSALAAVTALPCSAQSYPSRPVQMVVGYAPGGLGDVVARLIAEKLATALGGSVVVDNRAGASGAIAAQFVARAPPDGHTLLVGQTAEVAINQYLIKGLAYDPVKDLQPVALAGGSPLALVTQAPYANFKAMLEALRSKPLTFASAGSGTP